MSDDDLHALMPAVVEARRRFMELVGPLRPELHRYCSRMTGSVFDGEDVLQETLAKAHDALGQSTSVPVLRPWLFRIAHNTALDFLKRYERRHVELVSEPPEPAALEERDVDPALLEAALAVFVGLSPMQRSALVLKDVLGHSLEEVASTLGSSVGAVKAALSRARANVPVRASATPAVTTPEADAALGRYATLFNARDWDGLRALLTEEARLDLVTRLERRVADARYFDRYAEITSREPWFAVPGFVEGVPVVAMFRTSAEAAPSYFVLLRLAAGRVAGIRDFYYVPYIAESARFTRG